MAIIKKKVLNTLRADEQNVLDIAKAMKTVFRTVERWIRENQEDGPLTKVSAMAIIKKATGLTEDQILQEEAVTA